jgi:hypothetical protein
MNRQATLEFSRPERSELHIATRSDAKDILAKQHNWTWFSLTASY